jgi:hypothetical protein
MSRADSITQRPSGLFSAAAGKVVNQLRHSLSTRNLRQPPESPLSRAQREDTERQAKREQIKHNFQEVLDYYRRNTVLVEGHHSETDGAGNDHLKKRIPKRPARESPIQEQPEQEYQAQLHNHKGLRISIAVPENTPTPPTPPPKDPSPTTVNSTSPTPSTPDDTADRFISLTTTTCTSANQSPLIDRTNPTWNSALTTNLKSDRVDSILAAEIRARAPAHQASSEMGGGEQVLVDMRAVRRVPNFSCPLVGARWYERRDLDEWEKEKALRDEEKAIREKAKARREEERVRREEYKARREEKARRWYKAEKKDSSTLCREASPVLKGHELNADGGEDADSLTGEPSPVSFGSVWKEVEDFMRSLKPERVSLNEILSEVNPKYAVQTDKVEVQTEEVEVQTDKVEVQTDKVEVCSTV